MADWPIFAIRYDEKYSAMPFRTVNVISMLAMAIHALNQSFLGTRLLRSNRVLVLTVGFCRNWSNIGTSRAPVAVSNTAPRIIAMTASKKVGQYGRTYRKRR